MAADGSLNFDVRIQQKDVEKDLAKVEAKLAAVTKQIQASSRSMAGVSQKQQETYKALFADAKRLREESAKIASSGIDSRFAFNELKKSFENSVMAVKDFKAEMAMMSDDGRFNIDSLTDAQREYYDQLLKTAHGAEASFQSVEQGITLVDRATRRLRALFVTLGVGLLITAFSGLISKAYELAKAMAGIEDASKKLDRQMRIALSQPIEQQKKELKGLEAQYHALLIAQLQQAEVLESTRAGFGRQTSALKAMASQLWETHGAIFALEGMSKKAFIGIASDENLLSESVKRTKEDIDALTGSIAGNGETIQGNIAHIRSWRKEWEDAYKVFQQVTPGSIAGFTLGVFGTEGLSDTITKLDELEEKQKSLATEENNLQVQRAGASKEQKAAIQERLNAIGAEKQETEELKQLQQDLMRSYAESAQVATAAFGDAAEAFGRVLGEGGSVEQAVQALGQVMVQSAIQVYSGVADQLIAWGTLALLAPQAAAAQGLHSGLLAQGLAMKLTAGVLKGMLKYESGGVVPGNSRTGDKILARVNSGELILNQTQQARALAQMENGGGRPAVNVIINNNADVTVSAAQDQNGDIMVMIEQKTLETMASFKGQKIIRNASR